MPWSMSSSRVSVSPRRAQPIASSCSATTCSGVSSGMPTGYPLARGASRTPGSTSACPAPQRSSRCAPGASHSLALP
ncbi:hypothetical protein ACFPRL_15475 [Pseudoclavibacter helvolus]